MSMQIPTNFTRGAPDRRVFESKGQRITPPVRVARAQVHAAADLNIRETMDSLEKLITRFNRRFEFVLDEQINRIVVKVIDRDTDKLIKEIPPEEIQHLIARLRETMGLLVDEEI